METVFDGLSEFVSRKGRLALLDIIVTEAGSPSKAAALLEVDRSTVCGWLNDRKRHPNNENTSKILKRAQELNKEHVGAILLQEVETFLRLVNQELNKLA